MTAVSNRLPKGWRRRRLRFDATLNPRKSSLALDRDVEVSFVPMDAVGEFGGLNLSETRTLETVYDGYTYFADGDICIAKITPCFENGKGALAKGLINGIGFGTTELHIVRPTPALDARFLFYTSNAHDFRSYGASEMLGAGGQKRVPEDFIKDWQLVLPPPDTQRRIAQFLDDKTARIDRLIQQKWALLDRLAEKRQALITHAVTKGLNPKAAMRFSGIDWIGDLPEHWEVRGLTKCTTRVDYRGATPTKASSGVFLVTAKNIKNGRIDYEASQEYIPEDDYEYVMRRGKPKIGEVLFTTEAPLGEIARVDNEDVALAQRIIKFSSSISALMNDYLAYWMSSSLFQRDLQSRATGSTALGIKASKISELRCLLPPITEQEEIVKFLDEDAADRSKAIQTIRQSIERLGEYRMALITAAVNGNLAM
jgi:type I restriction enzyme S subunit